MGLQTVSEVTVTLRRQAVNLTTPQCVRSGQQPAQGSHQEAAASTSGGDERTNRSNHDPPMDFRISDVTKAMYDIACSVEIQDASARA